MKLRSWLARIGMGLLGLTVLAGVAIFALSQARLSHAYIVPVERIPIPARSKAVAHGHPLAVISGCVDCHGQNLSGRLFFESAMIGRFIAPNLTKGKGGSGGRFSDEDWVRA